MAKFGNKNSQKEKAGTNEDFSIKVKS